MNYEQQKFGCQEAEARGGLHDICPLWIVEKFTNIITDTSYIPNSITFHDVQITLTSTDQS